MKRISLALVIALAAAFFASGAYDPAYAQVPTVPHYECYQLPGVPPTVDPVDLTTQFGTSTDVVVGAPTRLCLPTLKNGEGDLNVPHVECYGIPARPPANRSVNLTTQFGVQTKVMVGIPREVCVPVSKAIAPEEPAGPPGPVPHYECYEIVGPAPTVAPVDLTTQFGVRQDVAVGPATRLCLPALKNGEEGDLTVPHVECYAITGAVPAKTVNLLNQFGPTTNQSVGPPMELCVPALKGTWVGGIAEAPEEASSLEATASDDSSSTTYGIIAAAAAAGIALAGGGVWYARRRIRTS